MIENDDIEEGEIIEISDSEAALPNFDSDLDLLDRHSHPASSNKFKDVGRRKNKDTIHYDMDDYELLVARQSLLKQQLHNYNAHSDDSFVSKNTLLNGNEIPDEDHDIENLRKTLLEQKSKRGKEKIEPENVFKRNSFKYNAAKSANIPERWGKSKNADTREKELSEPIKRLSSPVVLLKPISNPPKKQGLFMPFYTVGDTQTGQTQKYEEHIKKRKTRRSTRLKNIKEKDLLSPSFNTRSKKSFTNHSIGITTENQIKSRKRKTRRGKRGKKSSTIYAEQSELDFLQEQANIYDNYTNVPMDIDDDDSTSGTAPLPLIETPEIRPPLPPPPFSDLFKPAFDQAASQMENSNVAWMPGYVESLDKLIDEVQDMPASNKASDKVSNDERRAEVNIGTLDNEEEKVDESEVWALRAQALKSLACKRAIKVKEVVKQKSETDRASELLKASLNRDLKITSPISRPVQSGSSTPTSSGFYKSFQESPIHPPVVIHLTSDDFDDSDDVDSQDEKSNIVFTQEIQRQLKIGVKRSSSSDEHLLKELQTNTERSSLRLKKISTFITRDQLQYKKLQTTLSEKKAEFNKQSMQVRYLHEQLKEAIKKRNEIKTIHNTIFTDIKSLRSSLSKKLSMRNKLSEDVLRARSIASASRAKNTELNVKFREQMLSLNRSMIEANQRIAPYMDSVNTIIKTQPSSNLSSISIKSTQNNTKSTITKQLMNSKPTADVSQNNSKSSKSGAVHSATSESKLNQVEKKIQAENENKPPIQLLPAVKSLQDLSKVNIKSKTSHRNIHSGLLDHLKNFTTNNQIFTPFNVIGTKKSQEIQKKGDKSTTPAAAISEYQSPLLCFKSYRLSSYFRTQSKLSLLSSTYANKIPARATWCRFDINGACNDGKCRFWHFKEKCNLSIEEIITDLIAYDEQLFKAENTENTDQKLRLLKTFVNEFEKQYSTKISPDERVLLVWNNLKESRKKKSLLPHECISFVSRKWLKKTDDTPPNTEAAKATISSREIYYIKRKVNHAHQELEQDEQQQIRYFSEAYDSINVLENAISENPTDVKLWLSLAKHHLNKKTDKEENSSENNRLEAALGVLSRALEQNRDCEELWIHYLKLFSKSSTPEDIRELCYQAVMYAATYNVWWTCLELETHFRGKHEICSEMMKFIIEEELTSEFRSHYLLEILLCLSRFVISRGQVQSSCAIITAALGGKQVAEEKEKIHVTDVSKHLSVADKAILWMCSISIQVFGEIPSCLFAYENQGTCRLVSKKKFILDWKNIPSEMSHIQVRRLFKVAFDDLGRKTKENVRNSMLILENYVAFQLDSDNTPEAVSQLRFVIKNDASFVEALVLLFSVYVGHSSVDTIVTVAEDFIHQCEHDIEFVYHYAKWLHSQGMPSLAIEKLSKAIFAYFEMDQSEETLDVLFLYKKVLALPVPYNIGLKSYLPRMTTSQHLLYYYWMCYCLLLKLKKVKPVMSTSLSATDEAFEAAVHQYTSKETSKKLWTAYIDHRIETLKKYESIPRYLYEDYIELLFRCLISVPALSVVSQNVHWRDYTFHNKLLYRCLQFVPGNEHAQVLKRAIQCMPDNTQLAVKVCEAELQDGNFEQARHISAFLLQDFPNCLPLWQTAIHVELKCNCIREARWLYDESLKNLPSCEILWQDYAQFEVENADDLHELDEKLTSIALSAEKNGVNLRKVFQKIKIS